MFESKEPEPLFSVVIPTRQRAHLVADAVASVLAQDCSDFEVLVVDDGSCQPPARFQDPRARRLLLPTPGGVSAARNAGIAASRGRIVAFLDDDDLWPADFLSRVRTQFVPSQRDFCWSAVRLCDSTGLVSELRRDIEGDWRSPGNLWTVLGLAISYGVCARRELFERYGGFATELRTCEDFELLLRWQKAGLRGMLLQGSPVLMRRGVDQRHLSDRYSQRARDMATVLRRENTYLSSTPDLWRWAHQLLAKHHRAAQERALARQVYAKILRASPLYLSAWLDLLEHELEACRPGRWLASWVRRGREALR